MTLEQALHHRRSIRLYKPTPIDPEVVKRCLELSTLAPNSSNMQMWEFHHVTDAAVLKKLSFACLNQGAATTAQQMVVFVTRRDVHRRRAKQILRLSVENIQKTSPKERQANRIRRMKLYYGRVMPLFYTRFFGLLGLLRKNLARIITLFRPIVLQVSEADTRVTVHKTCALAAQTFMLAMASEGLDTCPMEGFDSWRVRRALKLPWGAEVNMIVSCGIRDEKGVWGERVRIPFDEVYRRVGERSR
jgi:nitroreductase